jgi:hypothetical protein
MVSLELIEDQLKKVGFNINGWGRTEVRELQNIILPDEEIFECVNGLYEGGFALLVATDVRVLLIDKKPLNYLTVEDMRFDMINEIEYNHRLVGAYIKILAAETTLKFSSLNQVRLRKLIGHVQHSMAEAKKKQATHPHLEQINQQLQSYLLAQYEQQQKLQEQLQKVQLNQENAAVVLPPPEPVRPSPELADYLFAQSLLEQHKAQTGQPIPPPVEPAAVPPQPIEPPKEPMIFPKDELADLYSEGRKEIFGSRGQQAAAPPPVADTKLPAQVLTTTLDGTDNDSEGGINPLQIAYSKLPTALRNRKFGGPAFHAPGQEAVSVPTKA